MSLESIIYTEYSHVIFQICLAQCSVGRGQLEQTPDVGFCPDVGLVDRDIPGGPDRILSLAVDSRALQPSNSDTLRASGADMAIV